VKVRYTAEANANIAAIARFLRPRSPSGLLNVRADIRAGIARIAENPLAGREQANGVRKAVTKRYSYLIYYAVVTQEDAIDIVAVQHPAQQRPTEDT